MKATTLAALTAVVLAGTACWGGGGGGGGGGQDCSGPPPPLSGGISSASVGATPVPVPTVEIALRTTAGGIVVAAEGATAAVTFAPQGGFILLAGIRAQGFDECVEITAAIKDEAGGNAVVSLEQRPSRLEDGGDGWLYPHLPAELYNWANLPACQTAALSRDFEGETYLLEITAEDGESISTASRHIVPRCAYADTFCIDVCTLDTSGALTR